MKTKVTLAVMTLLISISFCLQILGLMHIIPIWLSSSILFASMLLLTVYLNDRKRFKGF